MLSISYGTSSRQEKGTFWIFELDICFCFRDIDFSLFCCRLLCLRNLITGYRIDWLRIFKSWDAELIITHWSLLTRLLKWGKCWLKEWGRKVSISLLCIWGNTIIHYVNNFFWVYAHFVTNSWIFRFESDMLAFSGCYYGGGDKERGELQQIRRRWKTLHVRHLLHVTRIKGWGH